MCGGFDPQGVFIGGEVGVPTGTERNRVADEGRVFRGEVGNALSVSELKKNVEMETERAQVCYVAEGEKWWREGFETINPHRG